jgi:hypothetical protein
MRADCRQILRVFSSMMCVCTAVVSAGLQARATGESGQKINGRAQAPATVSRVPSTASRVFGREFPGVVNPAATQSSRSMGIPHNTGYTGSHRAEDGEIPFTVPDGNSESFPLSYFCGLECGGASIEQQSPRVSCWVPREGRLAVIPFSHGGRDLCEARRGLCEQIRDVGKFPDALPVVCKDAQTRLILWRQAEPK